MAVVWGVVFGLLLWWGSDQLGLSSTRAILLGLVGGIASAFYVYTRGAAADGRGRRGSFLGRWSRRRGGGDEPEPNG